MPTPLAGRTITFNNNTAATNLDLYLTVGGPKPAPLALLTTIPFAGSYVWAIPVITGWNGNFNVMPSGCPPMVANAGPNLVEFGLNQDWVGSTPEMRDTFDLSTVPPGIGTGVNNGPRSAAVAAAQAAGYSLQQSYCYNCGVTITPPASTGGLTVQAVTCTATDGDCADAIGYPNDTAFPKQQTGGAIGNYTVTFLDPVVSLP